MVVVPGVVRVVPVGVLYDVVMARLVEMGQVVLVLVVAIRVHVAHQAGARHGAGKEGGEDRDRPAPTPHDTVLFNTPTLPSSTRVARARMSDGALGLGMRLALDGPPASG